MSPFRLWRQRAASTRLGDRRSVRAAVALLATVTVTALVGGVVARAGDAPGFYWGTDSDSSPSDTTAPYAEPICGGNYGAYIGKIGGAELITSSNPNGSTNGLLKHHYNVTSQKDANVNHFDYGISAGAGIYWYSAGPVNNPYYDESFTPAENAYKWGVRQANAAISDMQNWEAKGNRLPFQALFMDIEDNGVEGWANANDYLVRQEFNGFFDTVSGSGTGWSPGMYSSRSQWGTYSGSYYSILNTWEWTTEVDSPPSPSPCPQGWGSGSKLAVFFGGQHEDSDHAIAWQWCGAGCKGTFDQVYFDRLPAGW